MNDAHGIRLDYRRLKTSRGRFPVDGIEVRNSPRGHAEIAYSFPNDASGGSVRMPAFDLETLACALPSYPLTDQGELVKRISAAARASGPLFGAPQPESLSDWMAEIRVAQVAIGVQRAVNGDAPLDGPGVPVVKSIVKDASGNVAFSSYCLSFASGIRGSTKLEATFPRMPWMKRFTADEGSCDYVFVCADNAGEQHVIDVHLIAFPQDIPTVDYSFVTAYFDSLGHDVSAIGGDYETAGSPALADLTAASVEECALASSDIPQLQHLAHALIALHTEPVHVDLFKSDGSRDFLAFDTYLSSLWYDFAMRLGKVKVGYCVQCGRGFSLTGHRGMDKEYCGEACRTQAKNERRRAQVAQLRSSFMEGASVNEIAKTVYGDMAEQPARDAVRKSLRKWPKLKHAIEDDLKNGDGSFTKRCLDERAIDKDFVIRKVKAITHKSRPYL